MPKFIVEPRSCSSSGGEPFSASQLMRLRPSSSFVRCPGCGRSSEPDVESYRSPVMSATRHKFHDCKPSSRALSVIGLRCQGYDLEDGISSVRMLAPAASDSASTSRHLTACYQNTPLSSIKTQQSCTMFFKPLLLVIYICATAAAPLDRRVPKCTITDAEQHKPCKYDCVVQIGDIGGICPTGTCDKEYIDFDQGREVRSISRFIG